MSQILDSNGYVIGGVYKFLHKYDVDKGHLEIRVGGNETVRRDVYVK